MGIKMEQGGNTSRNNNDGGDNSSSHTTTKKHKTKKRNREKDLNNERIGNSGKSGSSDSGESGVVVGSSHDKTNIKKKRRTNRPTITIGTKTNSIKKESIRKESIKTESIKEESIKKESIKIESIKIESIKKESIKKESGSDGNAIITSPTPTSTSNTNPTQTLVKNKNSNSSITNSEQQQQQLLFPIGKKAKQEFLKVFRKTSDPYGTISFYQKTHSLHTFLAKGLGTVPKHEQQKRLREDDDDDDDDDDTNSDDDDDDDSDDSSNDETNSIKSYESTDTESSQEKETFNPEPVLTFLSHLGISRCEMHNRISTALRIELEDEISRTFLGRDKKNDIGRERLSELLMSAMKWHDIPMIRPVVAAVLRKLGDLTPLSILAGLAKRKGSSSSSSNNAVTAIATKEGQTLVYGDLLRGLGPQLRRLVHEAEFCRDVRGDGERIGPIPQPQSNSQHSQNDVNLPPAHLNGTSLLVEMVRPAVVEYVSDINLRRAADHVWGIKGQHRFDTRERRRRKKIEDVVVTATSAAAAAAAGDTISTESNKGNESNTSFLNVNPIGIVGKTTGTLSALTAGKTLPIQGQIPKGQLKENKSNTNIKSNQTNSNTNNTNTNTGPSCAGNALAKIREVVGTRPKILAAILNMLIAEHGILTEVGSNNVNVDHSNADTTTTASNLNNIDNKNKYNNNNNNNVTITTALALAVATTNPLLSSCVVGGTTSTTSLPTPEMVTSTSTNATTTTTTTTATTNLLAGGASHLHCSLAIDLLLSHTTTLPRPYEYVNLLANVIDSCVRVGTVSGCDLAKIQGCLRAIFQSDVSSNSSSNTNSCNNSYNKSNSNSHNNNNKGKNETVDASSSSTTKGSNSTTVAGGKKNSIIKINTNTKGKKAKKTTTITKNSNNTTTPSSSNSSTSFDKSDSQYKERLVIKIIGSATSAMREVDENSLFLNPVTDKIAPGYSTIIDKPMCISVMESKCLAGEYSTSLSSYESDVNLLFKNCIRYNTGKDGSWFRTEATRQQKVWREDIMKQAKELFRREITLRGKVLIRAEKAKAAKLKKEAGVEASLIKYSGFGVGSSGGSAVAIVDEEKKRKETLLARQRQIARGEYVGDTENEHRVRSANGTGKDGGTNGSVLRNGVGGKKRKAIAELTASDILPLTESRYRKRKKESTTINATATTITNHNSANSNSGVNPNLGVAISTTTDQHDYPSMPALASLLLSDPFFVRILLNVTLELLSGVVSKVTVPAAHATLPSILQVLQVVQSSTQICSVRGRKYFVPGEGLEAPAEGTTGGGRGGGLGLLRDVPFSSLRRSLPLLAKLLLELELDRRMLSLDGDLRDLQSTVQSVSSIDPEEWNKGASDMLWVPKALVQGAMVRLLLPGGGGNEAVLVSQIPRFVVAIDKLSGGDIRDDRPFFVSIVRALVRLKTKLLIGTRDLLVTTWLGWFKIGNGGDKSGAQRGCMTRAVHECFVWLLNEWASLGNTILTWDNLMSFSENSARAAQSLEEKGKFAESSSSPSGSDCSFAQHWLRDVETGFSPVKCQYQRMLKTVLPEKAKQWKESLGIDDASLAVLTKRMCSGSRKEWPSKDQNNLIKQSIEL